MDRESPKTQEEIEQKRRNKKKLDREVEEVGTPSPISKTPDLSHFLCLTSAKKGARSLYRELGPQKAESTSRFL